MPPLLLVIAVFVVLIVLVRRRPDPHHEFMLQMVKLLDYEHRIGTPEKTASKRSAASAS